MTPEIDKMEPLNADQSDDRSCEYVNCKEKNEDSQPYNPSEIESKTVEEGKIRQATQGDEIREMDATDEPLEHLKLSNRVREVTMIRVKEQLQSTVRHLPLVTAT